MTLVAALAALVPVATASPASASLSTIEGSLGVTGVATMGVFPCATCGGGTFAGTGDAILTGVDLNGNPYSASWSMANLSATFQYFEGCGGALAFPPLGGATGTFTLTGGHFVAGGTGDPATLSGTLLWSRYGTVARIDVRAETVSGFGGTVATALVGGEAPATFVPLPPIPTCTSSGSLSAVIAAAAIQIV